MLISSRCWHWIEKHTHSIVTYYRHIYKHTHLHEHVHTPVIGVIYGAGTYELLEQHRLTLEDNIRGTEWTYTVCRRTR